MPKKVKTEYLRWRKLCCFLSNNNIQIHQNNWQMVSVQWRNATTISNKHEDKLRLRIQTQTSTNCPWNVVCLFEFTHLSSASMIKPKSSIERLSESGLGSVEESHGVRDAVEGQNTCTVIQVHSNSVALRTWDGSVDIVVPKFIIVIVTI